MEAGESFDDALRRELREELGFADFAIGPLVWRRHHTFDWEARRIAQREEYRIVHVARFDLVMSDAVEARTLDRFEWWRVRDLATATERFRPFSLDAILRRYIAEGAPTGPLVEEVLVD